MLPVVAYPISFVEAHVLRKHCCKHTGRASKLPNFSMDSRHCSSFGKPARPQVLRWFSPARDDVQRTRALSE